MYKLAVDAMGGDYGPSVTVPACVDFLAGTPTRLYFWLVTAI